jgi:hypothetical protein
MNAPFPLPVVPAASEQQETAPATCDRFGGACCSWACCKAPVKLRTAPVPAGDLYIDLNIPDADYNGADPLTVFAANHEHKAAADAAFDNRPDRLLLALEGD